jgi:hypothetical protein
VFQPEDQATLRDNTGSVYIEGRITPRFQRGLKVRLVFDGLAYGEPQNTAVFVLRDIDRGEHTIQLELIDICICYATTQDIPRPGDYPVGKLKTAKH